MVKRTLILIFFSCLKHNISFPFLNLKKNEMVSVVASSLYYGAEKITTEIMKENSETYFVVCVFL